MSPAEMAAADDAAIRRGTPVEILMDRAGHAVARAAVRLSGGRYGKRVVVICGKGNNAGDGFVAARVLAREGLGVRCMVLGDVDDVSGTPRHHLELLHAAGVRAEPFVAGKVSGDVVVDALFGTGFRGRPEGVAAEAIAAINAARAAVVSVDIPSGVDGTTGAIAGGAVRADVTVAMGAEKIGTAVGAGAVAAGRVEVADIGIPLVSEPTAFVLEDDDVAIPARPPDAHKRTAGAAAILAGSDEIRGAPVLTALGAVRAGAGYATLGTTAGVKEVVHAALPEVLCVVVGEGDVLGPPALTNFKDVLDRADALAIGPGIGRGSDQRDLLGAVLGEVSLPVVIDADGLNVLAGRAHDASSRTAATVLTPHPAELARLLDTTTDDVQRDRLGAARRAAHDYGSVVLLKGFNPIVARPDGVAIVVPGGGPALATAGTGDVLTGIVTAFLARGMEPDRAATSALYVGGHAAAIATRARGVEGLLASDVADALPAAVATLRG